MMYVGNLHLCCTEQQKACPSGSYMAQYVPPFHNMAEDLSVAAYAFSAIVSCAPTRNYTM